MVLCSLTPMRTMVRLDGIRRRRNSQVQGLLMNTRIGQPITDQITSQSQSTSGQSYGTLSLRSAERPWSEAQILPRWLGFLLMNVGEIGNFISYAFAPASVVAPLGTVMSFRLSLST